MAEITRGEKDITKSGGGLPCEKEGREGVVIKEGLSSGQQVTSSWKENWVFLLESLSAL